MYAIIKITIDQMDGEEYETISGIFEKKSDALKNRDLLNDKKDEWSSFKVVNFELNKIYY
jgi:hypothetical protein